MQIAAVPAESQVLKTEGVAGGLVVNVVPPSPELVASTDSSPTTKPSDEFGTGSLETTNDFIITSIEFGESFPMHISTLSQISFGSFTGLLGWVKKSLNREMSKKSIASASDIRATLLQSCSSCKGGNTISPLKENPFSLAS